MGFRLCWFSDPWRPNGLGPEPSNAGSAVVIGVLRNSFQFLVPIIPKEQQYSSSQLTLAYGLEHVDESGVILCHRFAQLEQHLGRRDDVPQWYSCFHFKRETLQ